MSSLLPVAVYGLKVPAGDMMIPATVDFPATFRITMAAIDPSEAPEQTGTTGDQTPPRATLKIVYNPVGPDDESDSDYSPDDDALQGLLGGGALGDDDEEDDEEDEEDETSSDDDEKNGGPSDQSKTKKARKAAAAQQILKEFENAKGGSDDDMEVDNTPKINGLNSKTKDKGKAKALPFMDDEEEDDESDDGLEELVVCTLDPQKNYQQALDLVVPEGQDAYFKVSGTHSIYLTGNYVIPNDNGPAREMYDDDEDDYDLEPYEDELDALGDDESDELDALEDPRITEVESEDDAKVPELVRKEEPKKGKNKRPAEESDDEPSNLDDIMAKSLKPAENDANQQPKLSKKQLKKLKKNDGKAAVAAVDSKTVKADEVKEKTDKKVSFAKNLEQPPTPSASAVNGDSKPGQKADKTQESAKVGIKVVKGVKIDDRKLGKGPVVKKGSKVSIRYIGKLSDGKVFDANKKGPAFKFQLGSGNVIEGMDIGTIGMAAGGERRIIIPAHLAYKNKKMPDIPPNSELTFDIKMLEVV